MGTTTPHRIGPSVASVRAALEKILASPGFASPDRLTRFQVPLAAIRPSQVVEHQGGFQAVRLYSFECLATGRRGFTVLRLVEILKGLLHEAGGRPRGSWSGLINGL